MAPEFGKPIHHLPLIPADILKKHHVHEPLDPRFRSAARLLQALWREERGLPIGSHLGEDSRRHKLGSRISQAAGAAGGNFLTAEIFHIVLMYTNGCKITSAVDGVEGLNDVRPLGRIFVFGLDLLEHDLERNGLAELF
jgi:hypothetical protein